MMNADERLYRAAKERQRWADVKYQAKVEAAKLEYEDDLPIADVQLIRQYEAAENERLLAANQPIDGH